MTHNSRKNRGREVDSKQHKLNIRQRLCSAMGAFDKRHLGPIIKGVTSITEFRSFQDQERA